jgi:transposase
VYVGDMRSPALPQGRDEHRMEARRLAAVPRLQRGEPLALIARSLGVSRQAVRKWAQQYRRGGAVGLQRRQRAGRPPKLARAQLAQLPRLLMRGAEAYGFPTPLRTTQRVADLLWQRFRVRYDRDHVCCLLHRFGWSWQKPARRARERGETASQDWIQYTWPRLKRKPKRSRPPWSLSTRAASP